MRDKYHEINAFLADTAVFPASGDGKGTAPASEPIRVVTVTGVGSSALGSVAFAWNVSETLHEPVAAIVPGYGLADVVPQGLIGGARQVASTFASSGAMTAKWRRRRGAARGGARAAAEGCLWCEHINAITY